MGNPQLYMVRVDIVSQKDGIDLAKYIQKLHHCLAGYWNASKVLHRFKVTGEATMLAIFEVSNVVGLERTVAGLWRLGGVSVTCKPVIKYENFCKFLGVDEKLLETSPPETMPDEDIYWLEFTVTHPGVSIKELLNIWMQEATAIMTGRCNDELVIKLYKDTCEKTIHAFLHVASPEQLDQMTFNLPIVQALGDHVKIKCRAIQNSENLQARILTEVL